MAEDDDLVERLTALAAPRVEDAGAELLDVEVRGYTGSRVVRLVVDADDGVDIETVAAVSRGVEAAFDDVDAVAGSYTLQVTSPGVDRPLTTSRDFVRNLGRTVVVTAREQPAGKRGADAPDADAPATREIVGEVVEIGEDAVVLEVDDDRVEVPLADIEQGRVQLPW